MMKFCKKCHRRVIPMISTNKDFTGACLCASGYIELKSGSEVEGFLKALAEPRNRKVKKSWLPVYLPHMES